MGEVLVFLCVELRISARISFYPQICGGQVVIFQGSSWNFDESIGNFAPPTGNYSGSIGNFDESIGNFTESTGNFDGSIGNFVPSTGDFSMSTGNFQDPIGNFD